MRSVCSLHYVKQKLWLKLDLHVGKRLMVKLWIWMMIHLARNDTELMKTFVPFWFYYWIDFLIIITYLLDECIVK